MPIKIHDEVLKPIILNGKMSHKNIYKFLKKNYISKREFSLEKIQLQDLFMDISFVRNKCCSKPW